MGFFSDRIDRFRDGIADLAGVSTELEDLREQSFTAQALARRFEDVNWWDLVRAYSQSEYQQSDAMRRRITERAWNYYFDHPVARRTVEQVTDYVLGSG